MGIWAAEYPFAARADEPVGQPAVGAPSPQAPAAAPAATAPPFAVLEFQVEGNTLLPAMEV